MALETRHLFVKASGTENIRTLRPCSQQNRVSSLGRNRSGSDRQLPGDHTHGLKPRPTGGQDGTRLDGAVVRRLAVVKDSRGPVEMGHADSSYDSCLVCNVPTCDGKAGRELAEFSIGESG